MFPLLPQASIGRERGFSLLSSASLRCAWSGRRCRGMCFSWIGNEEVWRCQATRLWPKFWSPKKMYVLGIYTKAPQKKNRNKIVMVAKKKRPDKKTKSVPEKSQMITWRCLLLSVTLPRGRSRSGTTHPTDFETETSMGNVFSSFWWSSYSEWSEVKFGIRSQCTGGTNPSEVQL